MNYANLHSQNHQLQEQVNIIEQSASSLPTVAPSTVVTSSGNYTWSPSISILNNGTDLYSSETIPISRLLPSQATNFMESHDLSFSFDQARSFMNPQSTAGESPLPSAKEETSDSFSKLRINPPFEFDKPNLPSSLHKQGNPIAGLDTTNSPYSASEQPWSFPNGAQDNICQSFGAGFMSFGHVFPNIRSIPASSLPSFVLSPYEGFNDSQALDLLSSPRTNYRGTQSSLGLFRECNVSLGHGDMQDSRSSPSATSNMKSGLFNDVTTRTKRGSPSSLSEPKDQSHNAEAKKSKSTLRSSNPPLKVRKEKLGDRISALHRLVAPFGKTDTASVLTEAIGYIHFLHDQVQTLSTPYMKSLQSKHSRKTQQAHGFGKDAETEHKALDLRSRGLCLVPVSCASYLNGFE